MTSAAPLRALMEDQYFPQAVAIRSMKTRAHYQRAVSRLQEFVRRDPVVTDLNEETIRGYMTWLSVDLGMDPTTVNGHRKNLLALARWLVGEHQLERMPRVRKLETVDRPPDAWSDTELERLIVAALTMPGSLGGASARDWGRAALALELQTAMRCEELMAIQRDWLTEDGRINVPSSARKGKRRGAVYRLDQWAVHAVFALAPYWSGPAARLLLDVDRATVYRWFDAVLDRAQLPGGRRNKWHKLRRTVATLVAVGNGNPTLALRNSSDAVTWASYVDQSRTVETLGKYLPGQTVAKLADANAALPVIPIAEEAT